MIYFYSQRYNKVKSEIVWENIDFFSIKGENRNTLSNCANVLSLVVNNCPNTRSSRFANRGGSDMAFPTPY